MTARIWTWIGGSNGNNQVGVYGAKYVPSATNRPGARYGHSMVMNTASQLLVMFGGNGIGSSSTWGTVSIWLFKIAGY